MATKIGQYYFARHRSQWGIWIVTYNENGVRMGEHVKDVCTFESAVKETYALNGWGEPKRIIKKF